MSLFWPPRPELDDPVLESPQPCKNGYNCLVPKCCAFVHPGEEGIGRQLFSPRISRDPITGAMTVQKARVRLIGTQEFPVGFYQRRFERLSWPEWCKKMGMKPPAPSLRNRVYDAVKKQLRGNEDVVLACWGYVPTAFEITNILLEHLTPSECEDGLADVSLLAHWSTIACEIIVR